MLRKIYVLAILLLPAAVDGQAARTMLVAPSDRDSIENLCASVANPLTELDPMFPWQFYGYHSHLSRLAGSVRGDTETADRTKIRRYLNSNIPKLLCLQANFNPRNGNILKLAIARQSNRFIDNVLWHWKPDLNQIDKTDGRTVLDYIRDRQNGVGAESSFGHTLGKYYARFRAAGAKHASELR